MLMLKSLSVLIVAASAAHALQSPAAESNLGERGTDGATQPASGLGNLPIVGGLLGGLLGGDGSTTGKVKRDLEDLAPIPNSATPVGSLLDTDSALKDVTPDHDLATPVTGVLPDVGGVVPQDAGLESLISGLHKRQDEDDVDSDDFLDAEVDLVRRGYRKAGVKSKVNDPKLAKPATFVKKSKKHPKTADKEHKEHKKHHPVA